MALIVVADVVGMEGARHRATLGRPGSSVTVLCLSDDKGVVATVPAGDPISDSAGAGSLRATIEGNGVTVALAKTEAEAEKIERYYQAVGTSLEGRLERRGRSVFVWDRVSSPTQRQAMYDCQYWKTPTPPGPSGPVLARRS